MCRTLPSRCLLPRPGALRRPVGVAVGLALALALTACGGDDDTPAASATTTGASVATATTAGDAPADTDADTDADAGEGDCALLRDDEVSAFAGTEMVHGSDTPLGCGWAEPGAVIDDFALDLREGEGSVAEVAEDLAPGLDVHDILNARVDEAVALFDGDEANFLVARRGDHTVVLVMTFLDVTSGQPLADAVALAELALDRAEGR